MTRREFLDALEARLAQLPQGEIERHLAYYEEIIDDMLEDGIAESRAIEKLGDVAEIAKNILEETPLPVLVKSRVKAGRGLTGLRIMLLVVGAPMWGPVVIALIAVLLSVYLVIWAVIVTLFAVVLAIALVGLALILGAFINFSGLCVVNLFYFGAGLALAGLSIPAFLGALAAAKGLVKLTLLIARGVKWLFIRKGDAT